MSGNTLTERYVREVVRRLPAGQRGDIAAELRTTIADTAEARGAADPAAAEREVLTEMGDPIRLAARYADRPLALIGPELYPAYIRLLKVLLATVLPIVTAVMVVIDVLENGDVGSAIGAGIGAVLAVGGQMLAWLTVVFALIDRSQRRGQMVTDTWSPDDLPDLPRDDRRGAGAYAAAAWNALLIGLIVWQHTAEPYRADGERLQVLDPDLWDGWIWPILLGLAAIVVLELVQVAQGGWTVPLACGYAVAELVTALPLAWIFYDQMILNPDFVAAVSEDWTIPDAFYTISALVVLAIRATEAVKRFREAIR